MKRSTQILALSTALMLGAGVVLGRLSTSYPVAQPTQPPQQQQHRPPPWGVQLGLTPDQQKEMDAIWADTRKQMDASRDSDTRHHQDLRQQRDDAIRKLLSTDQQAAYDKIVEDYNTKRSDLDKQREALIHSAEDRCRAMLSDAQKVKWDEMNKDMHNHRGGPHGPGGPGDRGPGDRGPGDHGPGDHGPGGHGLRGPSTQRSDVPAVN